MTAAMATLPAPIILRATYDETTFHDGDEDPVEVRGYTDPRNPWGGLDAELDPRIVGEAFVAWRDENADTAEAPTLLAAAHLVRDFPGAVWDYSDDGGAELRPDGSWRRVTLHVDAGQYAAARADLAPTLPGMPCGPTDGEREAAAVEAVFAIADALARIAARNAAARKAGR